jgi:hypothetical protein
MHQRRHPVQMREAGIDKIAVTQPELVKGSHSPQMDEAVSFDKRVREIELLQTVQPAEMDQVIVIHAAKSERQRIQVALLESSEWPQVNPRPRGVYESKVLLPREPDCASCLYPRRRSPAPAGNGAAMDIILVQHNDPADGLL